MVVPHKKAAMDEEYMAFAFRGMWMLFSCPQCINIVL